MGAGKSTLGVKLSAKLGWPWVDTDQRIQREHGRTVQQIFVEQGEAVFRRIERDTLAQIVGVPGQVVSTGGGVIETLDNRELLKTLPNVIYLRATPEQCFRRIGQCSKRPQLQNVDPLLKLQTMFARRDPWYREVADIIIESSEQTPDQCIAQILSALQGKV